MPIRDHKSGAIRRAATAALLLTLACTAAARADTPTPPVIPGMDLATRPGDDFFRHANGGWLDATEIPADRSRWGVGSELADQVNRQVADLIREAAARPSATADERRIGDFFTAYMSEEAIAAQGLAPLHAELARIDGIRDRRQLARVLGARMRTDVDPLNMTELHTENLIGMWVAQGLHDPAHYYPYLLQGGLGMPERDYYISANPRMAAVREKYRAHIATMFRLAGVEPAEERAAAVFTLERRLALGHVKREQSGDVAYADNTWTRQDFTRKAPGMDWDAYFAGAGLQAQQRFIVWHPSGIRGAAAQVAATPVGVWRDYLRFHAINQVAEVLPAAFADAHFAFYGTTLTGAPQQRLRWQRAVTATNSALGFAVGRLYSERYFPPASKARVEAIVANVIKAFGARIDALTWMTPATRAQARAKLQTLYVGIGYPERWRDYGALVVRPDDAAGNQLRAERFQYELDRAKLGKPVDPHEWWIAPQIVNAVNLPLQNALNFPAAILQPPFFDPAASDAYNYGAIGATIGHEISHSFDDQGAQFDARGRLRNWWTRADLQHFRRATSALVAQYDSYRPFPDLALNGQQTLGENIADLAGLQAAYDAFRTALGKSATGRADPDDRMFFLSYAQSWRGKEREAALRRQVAVDGHAPAAYRVLTVRNLDAWYRAFDVDAGQALYLEGDKRVRVW